jgi:chromosome segregation and condensation protein ScpB
MTTLRQHPKLGALKFLSAKRLTERKMAELLALEDREQFIEQLNKVYGVTPEHPRFSVMMKVYDEQKR